MRELDSYLNDHLAGSVGALELLDHWIKLCDGKPLAKFFAGLREEIEADQKTLQELMRTLGTKEVVFDGQARGWRRNLAGPSLAIAGDESGGLDLVLALETIAMGITGKKLFLARAGRSRCTEDRQYRFRGIGTTRRGTNRTSRT